LTAKNPFSDVRLGRVKGRASSL